ncbi:alkene reductase [Hoyosella rhizosphaerae]|uniref:Alkene reductase n=1 Tax=Hoyosella rhizosphaerae TaxID=1755582 RepID=A0A916U2H6_9ACTN|nr:alkene reductase [Hoyosella rhizosphaerae]MBN4927051.1 alkene reductase [Hoyosella rhizosphaerae]GGC54437.1 alkene reductase [Hoyosella rhizosphaerae]
MTTMWNPIRIGRIELPHRLAMAPMTRSRADADGTPNELITEYYTQRASLGLLITEGTQPSDDGQGYPNTPGIYTDSHIAGWRKVIESVHNAGASIYIQLMHVGRVAHPDNHIEGRRSVAPSAIKAGHDVFTPEGMKDAPEPRALALAEIPGVQKEFVDAAASAIAAGADGVELHGANGYLFWQFLTEQSNKRTDEYGGSVENRARFLLETTKQVASEIGADRVGVRLSPNVNFNGYDEGPNYKDNYRYVLAELDKLGLAYIHLFYFGDEEFLREIRSSLNTPLLLVRAGRDYESIERDLENNIADVFPIATDAISNPDLVERLKANAPLTPGNPATFYGGSAEGYTDYPTLKEQ